jgi:hypothetical protein
LALLAASATLLAVRLLASATLGFGDSEALYASYALHPQPVYLDHPGLIGVVARAIGGGTAPTPQQAHTVTALLATAWPLVMAATCRACEAPWTRAFIAGAVVALVPEIGVGLFALTPDLPLAFAWTLSIAAAAWALRADPRSARFTAGFALAGLLAGVACASKATGALLWVALASTCLLATRRTRSLAPWAGLAAGAVIPLSIVRSEWVSGWPMLRHRLVDTQLGSGLSVRNLGATVGGQVVYLSPLVAVLAVLAVLAAWRSRRDPVGALLLATFAVPFAGLLPLCLWSRAAEPHWLAPSLLALVPAAARDPAATPRRLVVAAATLSGAMVLAVHGWVLVPALSNLAPPSADTRLDISNELYGWPDVIRAVREEVDARRAAGAPDEAIAAVSPHWVLCAQLEAAFRRELPVGCNSPVRDDFDRWLPRPVWRDADALLWVTDTRFGPAPNLPGRIQSRSRQVAIRRGNRTVRVFTLTWLERRALAGAA